MKRDNPLRSLICRVAFFCAATLLCSSICSGQRPIAAVDDDWYVHYTITIKGEGTVEGDPGSQQPLITWKVDRHFEGAGPMNAVPPTSPAAAMFLFRSGFGSSTVKIHDSITKKYPAICDEWDEEKETWDMDTESPDNPRAAGDGPVNLKELKIQNSDGSHSIALKMVLPLTMKGYISGAPRSSYVGLAKPVQLAYMKTRTKMPDGVTQVIDEKRLASSPSLRLPNVPGWLKGGTTHKSGIDNLGEIVRKDAPFSQADGELYTFDSGEMVLDMQMLPGIDTTGQVTARVTYTLRRSRN